MTDNNKNDDALELVRLRNNFYRDNYRKVVSALLVALLAIIALVGAIVYLVMDRPAPTYFATTDSGNIIPIVPLDRPIVNDQSILRWATTAAVSAYTFNFLNYRQQLQTASQYFTEDGWQNYMAKLQQSGNLDSVIKRQLIVTSVPGGAPVIVNEGLLDGRYAWRIQMPLLATYQSSSQTQYSNPLLVTILVVRVSTTINTSGVAIAQINYAPAPATTS